MPRPFIFQNPFCLLHYGLVSNRKIWYDAQGNIKQGVEKTAVGAVGDITNYTNVVVATPFALAALLPREVWQAISLAIGAKQ